MTTQTRKDLTWRIYDEHALNGACFFFASCEIAEGTATPYNYCVILRIAERFPPERIEAEIIFSFSSLTRVRASGLIRV